MVGLTLGRICVLLGITFCAPDRLDQTSEFMFERCVAGMEKKQTPDYRGLKQMPADYTEHRYADHGDLSWISNEYPILLVYTEKVVGNLTLRGCLVEHSTLLHDQLDYQLSELGAVFDSWADKQIADGRYVERSLCGPNNYGWARIIKSTFRQSNGTVLHVFLLMQTPELDDFVIFVAAEAPADTPDCRESE